MGSNIFIEYRDLSTNEIKLFVEQVNNKKIQKHYGYFGYENYTYDTDFKSPPQNPMIQMINDYGKCVMFTGMKICSL